MAERTLVDATPDCIDRKSTESIFNSAHRKLRRLWFGESSFKLVPEAYRQKFRTQRKTENQSYVEFLREKENALDNWCDSKRIDGDAEKPRQLILAEEFLNWVPDEVRVHLREENWRELWNGRTSRRIHPHTPKNEGKNLHGK